MTSERKTANFVFRVVMGWDEKGNPIHYRNGGITYYDEQMDELVETWHRIYTPLEMKNRKRREWWLRNKRYQNWRRRQRYARKRFNSGVRVTVADLAMEVQNAVYADPVKSEALQADYTPPPTYWYPPPRTSTQNVNFSCETTVASLLDSDWGEW